MSNDNEKLPYCIAGDEMAAMLFKDIVLKSTLLIIISVAECIELALKKIQANPIHNPVTRNFSTEVTNLL